MENTVLDMENGLLDRTSASEDADPAQRSRIGLAIDRAVEGRRATAQDEVERLVEAAFTLIERTGNVEPRVSDILTEAGLSNQAFYRHFKGKHELLFFCQDRSLSMMLEALVAARLSGGLLRDRVHAVLVAHTHCLLDEMEGSAAHLEVDALPPELREGVVTKRDRYEKGLRGLVNLGIKNGEFEPCDTRIVTRALLGAINWTAGWFRPDGPKSSAAVATETADFLVRGLLIRKAAQDEKGGAASIRQEFSDA